jgi:hypothetical protein
MATEKVIEPIEHGRYRFGFPQSFSTPNISAWIKASITIAVLLSIMQKQTSYVATSQVPDLNL